QNIAQPNSPQFVNQMGLYQLAVQAAYPDYQRIVLAQHFLRRDEIVRHSLSTDEIDLLVEQVRLTIHETINAQRLGDHPAQEGGHCNFCDYASICPKKRHGILLEQTSDRIDIDDAGVADRAAKLANEYLDTHQKVSQYKAELESLKADIIEAAREFNLTKFEGDNGKVTIRLGQREKFITRTKDAARFAELSATARELGLDDYFIPDTYRIMKEIVSAGRLDPEAMERLRPFIEQVEENRINARFNASTDHDD
ncbi:MAG: PD-(D/E)XK nuclease family protein, partial [Candidatus Zixiibacteriota bacterium]